MDVRNKNRSFTIETLKAELGSVEKLKIDHENYTEGVTGVLDEYQLFYGKMPSGRYVYLYSTFSVGKDGET